MMSETIHAPEMGCFVAIILVPHPFKNADSEPEDQHEDRRNEGVTGEEGRAVHGAAFSRLLATFNASRFALA
jgi:hypothetical protein